MACRLQFLLVAFVAERRPFPFLDHIHCHHHRSKPRTWSSGIVAAAAVDKHSVVVAIVVVVVVQRQTLAGAVVQVEHYSCDGVLLVAWVDSVGPFVAASVVVVAFVVVAWAFGVLLLGVGVQQEDYYWARWLWSSVVAG